MIFPSARAVVAEATHLPRSTDVFAPGLENGSGNQLLMAQVEAVENADGQHAPAVTGGFWCGGVSRSAGPARPGRGCGGDHAAFPFRLPIVQPG